MLGAVAAKSCGSIGEAMASMSAIGRLTRTDSTRNSRLSQDEAKGSWADAKAGRDSRDTMQGIARLPAPDTKS